MARYLTTVMISIVRAILPSSLCFVGIDDVESVLLLSLILYNSTAT